MSSFFDKQKNLQEKGVNKYGFILVAIFLIWLFFPNNNSFIKLSFWMSKLVYNISKCVNTNVVPEYIHLRNNAVYLVEVYPKNPEPALKEISEAIAAVPEDSHEHDLSRLYRDSAVIKLFYGDKEGAFNDYMTADDLDINDKLRVAVLLSEKGEFSEASKYCNKIISEKERSLSGYVCLAYIHEKAGNIESASRIYDWLLEMKPNNAIVYLERAYYKQRQGDIQGFNEDIKKAESISKKMTEDRKSMIDEAINFKSLPLSII